FHRDQAVGRVARCPPQTTYERYRPYRQRRARDMDCGYGPAEDQTMTGVALNCAPALSPDLTTLYVAVSNGSAGYLVALNGTTLAPIARVRLKDPDSGNDATLPSASSASPTVGPDGDVYFGVLENPCCAENHD